MPDKSLLKEGHVFDEFTIYEFRIGSPDIDAIEAFGIILQRLSQKAKKKKKEYSTIFSNVAGVLKYAEVWIIFSAGLRMSVEECKKIPQKKLLEIYPRILEVNKHFFAETPEMVGRLHAVLIPKMTEEMIKSASSQAKESSSSKTTS